MTVSSTETKLTGAPYNAEVSITSGSDTTLVWRLLRPGLEGNSYQITYKNPGVANNPLTIQLKKEKTFEFLLATDSSGTITTTANDLINFCYSNDTARAYLKAIASGTTTGVVQALSVPSSFSGGTAATGVFNQKFTHALLRVETNTLRYKADANTPTSSSGILMSTGDEHSLMELELSYYHYIENLRLIRAGGSDATLSLELYIV
jgi:hypothetical protein